MGIGAVIIQVPNVLLVPSSGDRRGPLEVLW
jgi:hypothetical protein